MVRRTVTQIAEDCLHLNKEEKDELKDDTNKFLNWKYNSDAAKISRLSIWRLRKDARRFLRKHGRRHFAKTRRPRLLWPEDANQLVNHVAEIMHVQASNKKKLVRGTEPSGVDSLSDSGSSDGATINNHGSDAEYKDPVPDRRRRSPTFKLPFTRNACRKNITRQVAIVPTVESSVATDTEESDALPSAAGAGQNPAEQAPVGTTIIVSRLSDVPDLGNGGPQERNNNASTVRELPFDPTFYNESSVSSTLDHAARFLHHNQEQLSFPVFQLTPSNSELSGPNDLCERNANLGDNDAKPHLPPSEAAVIDMIDDLEIYLDDSHVRSLHKEEIYPTFQAVLDWLVDRSSQSNRIRRMLIRNADPARRAAIEFKAQVVSELMLELWQDPKLWPVGDSAVRRNVS